jgi:SAM-dependent methyltransferase
MTRDPAERFTRRVEHYVKYRPSYPRGVIDTLHNEGLLSPADVVADIGSGTGKLAELFLANGNKVLGIEPNRAMREAGEAALGHHDSFMSVEGRAEATTLQDGSVDIVTAGQAFHWFDPETACREFSRILSPGGRILIVWNDRQIEATPFMKAYEAFLQEFGTDYRSVDHRRLGDAEIGSFFGSAGHRFKRLANEQRLDRDGLRGRLLSTSYVPDEGETGYTEMLEALDRLFDEHQEVGTVSFVYSTRMYYGSMPHE